MAEKHCTGNTRSSKITTERKLTVGYQYYEYPPRDIGEERRTRAVPWLQMRGDWLAAAGFDIKMPVKVRVMPGCLVLTTAAE